MKLKYDLFDMVSASIMNSEPIVIVEGKDDYQIYQTISNAVNPKIQVYQVKELKDACRNELITQCRSCKVGNYNDCLFKTKQEQYRIDLLKDDVLTFVDLAECSDIVDVLGRLN
jgi:hypothetical protein